MRNTGWKKAVGKLCGGAPQPNKEEARIIALMDQYSEQAESSDTADEEEPKPKLLKLEVKLTDSLGGSPAPGVAHETPSSTLVETSGV